MSQSEIIELLSRNPYDWFTAEQLSHFTGTGINSIRRNCRKLKSYGDVHWKKLDATYTKEGRLVCTGGGKKFAYRFGGF